MQSIDLGIDIPAFWKATKDFLNSEFTAAFLSALAGAGLGVLGAQRVAERASKRKELVDALRQANALIVLSSTICNQALSVKNQHVGPLASQYFRDREAAEQLNATLLSGRAPDRALHFQANLVNITPLTVPIDALKNLTYSAQLMPGRALALVSMVEQSLTELGHAIRVRQEQVGQFRAEDMSVELKAQTYFGLKRRDGNTDSLYHDSMVAIAQYTDDIAFFSAELAEELQSHALRMRGRLTKLTKEAPKATMVDFSGARESGLMPPREAYEAWLAGFKSQD
jgi:hypothetical protein